MHYGNDKQTAVALIAVRAAAGPDRLIEKWVGMTMLLLKGILGVMRYRSDDIQEFHHPIA